MTIFTKMMWVCVPSLMVTGNELFFHMISRNSQWSEAVLSFNIYVETDLIRSEKLLLTFHTRNRMCLCEEWAGAYVNTVRR